MFCQTPPPSSDAVCNALPCLASPPHRARSKGPKWKARFLLREIMALALFTATTLATSTGHDIDAAGVDARLAALARKIQAHSSKEDDALSSIHGRGSVDKTGDFTLLAPALTCKFCDSVTSNPMMTEMCYSNSCSCNVSPCTRRKIAPPPPMPRTLPRRP